MITRRTMSYFARALTLDGTLGEEEAKQRKLFFAINVAVVAVTGLGVPQFASVATTNPGHYACDAAGLSRYACVCIVCCFLVVSHECGDSDALRSI